MDDESLRKSCIRDVLERNGKKPISTDELLKQAQALYDWIKEGKK